jgi:hypothetical protein
MNRERSNESPDPASADPGGGDQPVTLPEDIPTHPTKNWKAVAAFLVVLLVSPAVLYGLSLVTSSLYVIIGGWVAGARGVVVAGRCHPGAGQRLLPELPAGHVPGPPRENWRAKLGNLSLRTLSRRMADRRRRRGTSNPWGELISLAAAAGRATARCRSSKAAWRSAPRSTLRR